MERATAGRHPDGGDPGPPDFVEAVIRVIEAIPEGEVLTYGDVAALVGSRAARAVGRVLARYGEPLPWWRVVRSDGTFLRGFEAAALEHYEQEGTPLRSVNGARRVDLRAARRIR
jgi:alkylated DNA nucleotide flippase Atl1